MDEIDAISQHFRRLYPDALGVLTQMRQMRGPALSWPDWCWVPMGATAAYLVERQGDARDVGALHALTLWRLDRTVLKLDGDSVVEVFSDGISAADTQEPLRWRSIETRVLEEAVGRLPSWCPYIAYPPEAQGKGFLSSMRGIWVHREFDVQTGRPELWILFDTDGTDAGLVPQSIYLDRPNLGRAVDDMLASTFAGGDQSGLPHPLSGVLGNVIYGVLPLLLAATHPGFIYPPLPARGGIPSRTTILQQYRRGLRIS